MVTISKIKLTDIIKRYKDDNGKASIDSMNNILLGIILGTICLIILVSIAKGLFVPTLGKLNDSTSRSVKQQNESIINQSYTLPKTKSFDVSIKDI